MISEQHTISYRSYCSCKWIFVLQIKGLVRWLCKILHYHLLLFTGHYRVWWPVTMHVPTIYSICVEFNLPSTQLCFGNILTVIQRSCNAIWSQVMNYIEILDSHVTIINIAILDDDKYLVILGLMVLYDCFKLITGKLLSVWGKL